MEKTIIACYKNVRNNGKHIRPFIGSDYLNSSPDSLRMMAVGMNAHIKKSDWDEVSPEWFYGWAKDGKGNQRHKFFPTVHEEVKEFASFLLKNSTYFSGKHFSIHKSLYLTNAVTQYLLDSEGKESKDVKKIHVQEGAKRWKEELEILAENDVFPHVIVIYGRLFWDDAWKTFGKYENTSKYNNFSVNEYNSTEGECWQFLNQVKVSIKGKEQIVLLIGCHHPAYRRKRKIVPEWFFEQQVFCKFSGIN